MNAPTVDLQFGAVLISKLQPKPKWCRHKL